MRPPIKRTVVLVWWLTFLPVLLTTGRLHIRGDASQMCAVAASIGNHGWLDVARTRSDVVQGPDGKFYSKYPILTVLQCAPALGLKALGGLMGGARSAWEFLFTGIVPAAVAGWVAIFFLLCAVELGYSLPLASFGALLVVFTTPVWSYGRELYSENLQAALLLAVLWTALRSRVNDSRGWLVLTGVGCGLLLLTKLPLIVVPGFIALAVIVDGPAPRRLWRLTWCGLLGALPFLAVFFAYNYLRFGGILEQGYTDARTVQLGFSTPLYSGLHGLLFSTGKSVFLYAPLLIAAVLGLRSLHRREAGAVTFIVGLSASLFLLMAKFWAGLGDWAWGPRLVVPVIPLMALPALELMVRSSRIRWASITVLALAGWVVNLLGIIIDHSHYIWVVSDVTHRGLQLPRAGGLIRDDLAIVHFVPEFSPPVGHFWLLEVFFNGWDEDHWTPWAGIRIPAWEVLRDPTPPFLNHWSDGSPAAWTTIAIGWTLTFALLAILVVLLRRSPSYRPHQARA